MATKPMDQIFTKGEIVWCLFQSDGFWKVRQGKIDSVPRPGGMLGNGYMVRHGQEFSESYGPRNLFTSETSANRIMAYRNQKVRVAMNRPIWCPQCNSRRVAPGASCSHCGYEVRKR